MALGWKLVIDSHDAIALAEFWAAALEYTPEDQSALIEHLVGAGQVPPAAIVEHEGRQYFRGMAAIRHPDDPFDAFTGIGQGRRLLFQEVPEEKTAKNRLHIDVHRGPGSLDDLVARLEKLGATRVNEVNQGPAGHWWVMRDPQGNEFCCS
ncbi:VOC family protein [Kineosporia sp. NBRC 101731]|uniref:VOC family protein n=1 Tax=Kineosporia sp. NBRC 101731 TaxID=3032199 RepID=UPI0024A25976|nr:VOC family protein [Kineosporia sp. NBRC 101731]GLY32175.1 hypothetical protein Kisp02_55400 [Kineosporia sp. NBRC 101731]